MGKGRVIFDKSAIKITKAKEFLYVLDFGQCRPGRNHLKFNRVHV